MGETKEETHFLKRSCGSWEAGTSDRSVEEVVTFIKGFDVPTINQGAKSYKDAHAVVEEAREAIRAEAVKLAEVWGGEASVEAQKALGILYVTMDRLAKKLSAMSTPLETLATVVSGHQGFMDGDYTKGNPLQEWNQQTSTWDDDIPSVGFIVYGGALGPKSGTTEWDWGESQNGLAGKHLQVFSNDLAMVHADIPDTIQKSLRDIKPPAGPTDDPTPINYPTGTAGSPNFSTPSYDSAGLNGGPNGFGTNGGPSFGAPVPGSGVTDPRGVDPNTGYPPGTYPPGTNPPGTDVPGGTTPVGQPTNPNLDTTVPSTDTAGLNRNPSLTGPDTTTSLADYTPPTPTHSPTSATPTTPGYTTPTTSSTPGTGIGTGTYGGTGTGGGVIPGSGTSLGTRAGTGVGNGMPMLPMGGMGGAGGGGESRDRESTTWLNEDDDVWGDDTGSVSSRIG